MDKPKYKVSIIWVIIIFLSLDIILMAIGVLVVFIFIIPTIKGSQQASLDAQKKVQLKEDDYQNLIKSSHDLDSQKKFIEASSSAQQALLKASSPGEKGNAYYWISLELFNQGSFADSQRNAILSITLNPQYPYGYDVLSALSTKDKNYQQALDYAKKLVSAQPNEAIGYADEGIANFFLNNKKDAIDNFTKASQLDPKNDFYKQALTNLQQSKPLAPASTNVSPGQNYNQADIDALAQQLTVIEVDEKDLPSFLGSSVYNQTTIKRAIDLLNQRKVLINQVYPKMAAKGLLNTSDQQALDKYVELTNEYETLIKSIHETQGY